MAINIERMTVEDLVSALYDEKVSINDIMIEKANHREAFLAVLERRPALIAKLTEKNAHDWIKYALERDYQYFVYLKPKQYTNDLVQLYLYKRLTDNGEGYGRNLVGDGMTFTVAKSLDDSVIFNCTYTTPDGEELFFYDNDLKVPVGLKSSYKLTLKLSDAVALVKRLDTHITMLGKRKIQSAIEDVVGNLYKTHLSKYIDEKGKGFYALTTSYSEIEAGFVTKAAKALDDYGISVSAFVIKAIAIPKDVQYKIEDQAFEIRRRLADAEADSTLSKKSLEDYEAKLAIHKKYADVPMTLTEHEKDLALRRYLIRTGRNKTDEIDRNIDIAQVDEATDEKINKQKDIVPEITVSNFKRNFFIALALSALFIIIMFAISATAGAVFLVLGALGFGIGAFANIDKFSNSGTLEIPGSAKENQDDENLGGDMD